MPDKRKKKTREDAIELLKQKAANNGLKNQAQQGARTLKLNTTTEKDNVYTTPKSTSTQTTNSTRNGQNNRRPQTVNSSTAPKKSTTGTLTGSQSPSATDRLFKETAKRYTRGNDITARRQKYSQQTDNRNRKTVTTPTVRRNSRGQEVSGRDRTRSMTNVPTKQVLRKDTGKWAKNEAWGALTGLNADIASTVDFLLPDVITPKAVQKGLDYYRNANESQQQKVQALRKNSKTREIIGNIGVNAIQQIPTATMAFLSGGTSLAAQAAPSLLNPSTLTHTGNVVTRALGQVARDTGRNPMFWETFLRTAGNTYDNEVKNGASPVRATLSAYANGLLNAQIEVGGGVELYDPSETFLKAIARSAKEEGLEEVQQYAVENLVNKAIGSNTSKWFSMQRGDNAVINPVDMLEQGAYGAIGGGLAAGGRVAMAKTMSDIADTRYANAHPDVQTHAQELINRALVQGREGERMSNSERLAITMQEQMDRGVQIPTRQVMELENALRTDEVYNAQDYERRNRERYQQAVSEGRADTVQQQNTSEEYHGFRRRADETMQRNYDLARNTMGVNAPETSVEAVRNVITGSTDNYDIDTVLTDNEAKKAVEKITGVKLSPNNIQARSELENIALTRQIQNRDKILQETHESIRTNMSQRGGDLFDNNYDNAVRTLDVPNGAEIYDSFFSRFYTDGTVKGADFENSYNRIMSNVREDFGDDLAGRIGEVFNRQFAQKVFTEGQMAQATYNAKYQGKALSMKASESPAGFTYEDTARAKISDRQAELLTKFAERANVHIRLVDSIANGSANGAYKDGVIMIAADSTNKLVTVAKHELTHHIRATSPELYQKLEDFVLQKWYDADANAMEAKIQEYQRRYNNRPEEAREELIADAAESFFTDAGSIQAVVNHDRSLAQAIHDGIKTLLDTFLDLQDSDNLSKRGYGDFLDDIGILRDAERMWLEALEDSRERGRGTAKGEATEKSETKHSLKDSDGNKLTEAQAEYFKDSKVRDEEGNLLVMYHGTNEEFTVFKANEFIGEQNGLSRIKGYFSTSKDYSNVYGNTKPYYLNIKNPLYIPDEWKRLGEWKKWFAKQGIKGIKFDSGIEIDGIKGYGYEDGTKGYALWDLFDSGNYWYGDGNLTEKIENAGYDGIYWHEGAGWNIGNGKFIEDEPLAYMPFKENAIKLTSNENPTDNEDIRYSIKEAPPMSELDKSGATLTTNNGQPIAKFEENGSVQFSLKTYDDQGRKIYKEYLDKMVKNGQLSRAEAKQMFDEIETIYKISREFADTGKYAPFTAWSNAQVVTGENGKPVFSAIKKNSEYKMNIDFSTICKKRRTLDNVFRVMVNRGLFEKLDLNKDESAALVVNINDLIREHGFEAACALCFVEARRYRQQQTATTFRDMWNGLVESMYKDKSKIEYFNYGENNEKKPVPDGIHTMPDKDLNLAKLKRLANAKNDEGKPLQTAEAKAARLLLRDPSQRKLMLVGDMMASTGFENMQVKNPELMKIYNAKKGTGGAKSSFGDVQYLNEILRPRTFGRMSAYAVSGVRIQSFSDYVPRMVFDYVQVIGDLAAKRLPAHAYTKEILFALQFGLTGVKINMSLVPDVVADGVAPGLDKNGNYIWNKEGTFPWEDYVDKNGRKMPGARSIQKAKGYKENCGTIAVGISDAQIWKMLLDPEIQMVIPYHKSSLNPLVAAMTNVDRFTDYTDYQNTRDKNGKAVEKEFDWDRKLFRLSHGSNNKLLPRSEWGNVQALVKEYVDWCNKHEYTPKFSQFLYMREGNSMDGDFILDENGNKVINPGYYKMLEDFALYDNDGKFKPQDDVKMRFPTENDEFGSMASLIEQGLSEDTALESKRSNEIEGIVDEIEGMIEDGSITKQTIFSEALAKKMTDADTRFQLKDKNFTDSVAYKSTISKLESQVKDLKAEFKRTDLKTADQKQVRIQAGKLIKRHDSNMSLHAELQDTFNKIFRLYKEKGTEAFDEVYEIAKDEAVSLVNGIGFIHDEGAEEYKAIKDYLKTTPITISEDMKKNITDFNDFRKRYFGKLKLVNGEQSNIDNVYMELAEMFPEQFTEDYVNPHDQLNHIVDVLDNYAPYYETLDGASPEMQDYVVEIAGDIMETAYNLQTKKTFADKKYLEKEAAVEKARERALESRDKALKRITTRYQKQVESLQAELWKANERTAAERLRGEMDIQRLKKQQAESKEKARERKAESRERTKLLNVARRLDKLKTTEANRQQIDALIGDLDLVAKGMTDKSLDKLYELAQWYDDKAKNDPDFIPDSNIENKLKRLSKTHIKDMTIEEVRDLYDVLSNIENEIATEKKLIDSEVKKEIYEAGRETIKNINKSHGIANSIRKLDTFFVSGTLSPLRQIRRVTGYNDNDPLYIATKELADGQRKMLQYQMDSWKAFDRFMNDKKFIDSLNGKKAEEIEVTGMKDGEPFDVKITPDIRMAMYLAGMNEDNLRHMMYGGITLPDIKLYKKGKIAEAMESGETVRFSPSQIKEITSHMSKREKEFAQEAYKYYNITSPQAINEVSEVLKGYSLARVNNYFPIHTDSDFLTKEFESMKFDGTIEGMGFLKERVKASNPILMTGLVDTLTKSIEMNSKYVGLAIPVRNFSKILNVKDMSWDEEGNAEFRGAVKRSISKKWGKSVLNYIEKFMTDLQNGRKSSDEWGSVFSKARSRYAGAVLTLNASVAIKQAASYPTAAAVLGWAPLAKAMGNVGKVDLDLIAKYTPLQWYRSKGYSTTELGDITSSRTGNIPTPLNWIQGMDLLTTRKLWKASEYYVRQHNKSLKAGTDEYYKAVAEIYNKVIEETQPNYTTMQRPGLLRSDNEITLTLNMFKTQPYQNFNILFDAFGNYTAKRNQYKANGNSESKKALKEAGRDMQNAVTSQIAQLAVFAAMTSLWALFRRKDDKYRDEEGKLTIFSYMKKLGEDMISNLFAAVPLGADVYSMASSIFTGDTYYGFTSVTDSAITDVMDSFKNGAVAIGDWIEYGRSDNPEKKPSSDMYKETENVISSASRAMGIPASNLRNLVNGIYGWVAISADGEYIGTYEAQKMTFAKGKEMKQNLFRAYQNDKAAYEELRKMMIEDGFDEAKLDDYIKDQRKEHHTEEEQKEIDSTMQELEGSKIWKDATEDEKKDFTNRVTNIALGITNTDTESISKYVTGGLTEEQVILYKLALKKANRENDNNTSYNNDEKEAALRMLEQNYKLTQQQKDILKGKKS